MSAITYTAIQSAIEKYARFVMPKRPAIFQNQNAPRPNGAFLAMTGPRLVRETEINDFKQADLTNSGNVILHRCIHYAAYFDFEFVRDVSEDQELGAVNQAWVFQRSLYSTVAQELLGPEVIFIQAQEVLDLSRLVDIQYESRAQFTAQFRVVADDEIILPTIEHVNLNCDINGNIIGTAP